MLRLFVGLELPQNVRKQATALESPLPMTSWIGPERLHVGLRFLGSVEEAEIDPIAAALENVRFGPFDTALNTVGYFVQGTIPRNIWAGLANYWVLDELFRKVDDACIAAGQPPQERAFHAHVTLAKVNGCPLEKVAEYVQPRNNFRSDAFTVDRLHVFSSRRAGFEEHSFYTVERTFALKP